MTAWLNRGSGIDARNGTNSHTINFGFTSASGSLLVVIAYGAVTHTAAGWTEQLQPVSSGELSVFTKTSAGDSSITITNNGSNYPISWLAYEYPAGSTWTDGTGSNPTTETLPTLSGLPGTAQVITGCFGRVASAAGITSASATWGAPFGEETDLFTVASGTDGLFFTAGLQEGVTATSVTPTLTPTYGGTNTPADRQAVTFAISVAAGGTNASAGLAAATGSANDASIATGVNAAAPAASSLAFDAAASLGANAGASAASGVSFDAAIAVSPPAGSAAALGAALDATSAIGVQAGAASAAATAYDATVSTVAEVSAPADLASASATAYDATVATVSGAPADSTAASATALDALAALGANAGAAIAAAMAFDATVSTSTVATGAPGRITSETRRTVLTTESRIVRTLT